MNSNSQSVRLTGEAALGPCPETMVTTLAQDCAPDVRGTLPVEDHERVICEMHGNPTATAVACANIAFAKLSQGNTISGHGKADIA